jgi:hypothetical protein
MKHRVHFCSLVGLSVIVLGWGFYRWPLAKPSLATTLGSKSGISSRSVPKSARTDRSAGGGVFKHGQLAANNGQATPQSQPNLVSFYGPEVFVRGTGKPLGQVRRFSIRGYKAPFTLHVLNGGADGKNRVSAAGVWINGFPVLQIWDFNQQASEFQKTVHLKDPSTLEVWIASPPGSKLTIWIEGTRIDLVPILEQDGSVAQVIDGHGGKITATSAAGVQISLTVPKFAILSPTEIRITPITSINNIPWTGSFISGVKLEPEGLRFGSPLELAFTLPDSSSLRKYVPGFACDGGLNTFRLFPLEKADLRLTLSVSHFSSYGVLTGNDADMAASLSVHLSDPGQTLEQQIAAILAAAQARGYLTDSDRNRLTALTDAFLQDEVIPAVNAFINCVSTGDCPNWGELGDNALSDLEELELLSAFSPYGVNIPELVGTYLNQMGTALQAMYQAWNSECAQQTDCKIRRDVVLSLLSLAQMITLLGGQQPSFATMCGCYFTEDPAQRCDVLFAGTLDVTTGAVDDNGNGVFPLSVSGTLGGGTGTAVVSGYIIFPVAPPLIPNMEGGRFAWDGVVATLSLIDHNGVVTGSGGGWMWMSFAGAVNGVALSGTVTTSTGTCTVSWPIQ